MSDSAAQPSDAVHPGSVPGASGSTTPAPPASTATTSTPAVHPNIALGAVSIHMDTPTLHVPPTPQIIEDDVIDPTLLAADAAAAAAAQATDNEDADENGFDPATLANLAALSRIAHEEDDTGLEEDPEQPHASGSGQVAEDVSAEQMDAIVQDLRNGGPGKRKREPKKKDRAVSVAKSVGTGDEDYSNDDEGSMRDRDEDSDLDGREDNIYDEKGKLKRKRNRTVLSCTECHRRKQHCDRNIPCKRCVRRGVASMCKMEAPIMPERKKRKPLEESPVNYELGLRVQALESLIRAGTSMDADAANSAAMETILQATKAAGKGNVIAGNALASLSAAAGTDLSELESGERANLLMEVLQQLSDAAMPPRSRAEREEPEEPPEPSKDPWAGLPKLPSTIVSPPPTTTATALDSSDNPKLDLTLQGFREDNGRIFIPPTVRYVERNMRAEKETILSRDTLPIQGDERFLTHGTKLVYGVENTAWKKGWTHTLTGAIRVAASFLSRCPAPTTPVPRAIYIPSPTTPEDETAFRDSGLDIRHFRFMDHETGLVDWDGLRDDLQEATPKSAVLLYMSGTLPTGIELNAREYRILTTLLMERQLIPLCVLPCQGLATGEIDRDAQALKFMIHENLPVVVVQSFDAAMGIYADSPSIVSIPTQSAESKDRVDSHLCAAARAYHSYPAPWGAQIVGAILSDQKLYPAWLNEIKAMAGRLRSVREKLYDTLTNKLKTPGSWAHIRKSSGMQCTALLPLKQVISLAHTRNIHLNSDGTFSLGALNAPRIDTLARGIDYIVRESIREQEEAQARAVAAELALAAAREAAAKEEAEAAERAAKEAEEKAREEDTLLMEASIADAMEQQQREEEEEKRREEERREMDEAIRKAAERADMQRRAEEILASIGAT